MTSEQKTDYDAMRKSGYTAISAYVRSVGVPVEGRRFTRRMPDGRLATTHPNGFGKDQRPLMLSFCR